MQRVECSIRLSAAYDSAHTDDELHADIQGDHASQTGDTVLGSL